MEFVDGNTKSFTVGAAVLRKHDRVKLVAGLLIVAAIGDKELGTMTARGEIGASAAVRLRTAAGTTKFTANAALALGAEVFTAADGEVGASAVGAFLVGQAVGAGAADQNVVEVLRHIHGETAVT